MTQTETIVWHPYPDEKPAHSNFYLVHVFYLDIGTFEVWQYDGRDSDGEDIWINDGGEFAHMGEGKLIAWAELPKGWKE